MVIPITNHPSTRHIAFCLCQDLPLFGLISALEVLRHANRLSGQTLYRWSFLSETDAAIPAKHGLWLQASTEVQQAEDADIAFVIAGFDAWDVDVPDMGAWLCRQAKRGAVIGAISNGSFVLANLGLLNGYQATTHWEDFTSFHERYPAVKARYQRFVIDGQRITCSGGATTLDVFIEIVRRDWGGELAQSVARQMLLQDYAIPKQTGELLTFDGSHRYSPRVQRILSLLDAGIDGVMKVQQLAMQVGLSRRELLRLLQRETGQTPSQILNSRRLERARSLVQHSHLPLAEVANAVGFSSQSHLTLRYRQQFGITPAQDRRQHQHRVESSS